MVGHAPRSDRARDLARKLHQQGRRLEFLRRYLDLYMEYATAELRFSDMQTMALFTSLSEADRETFAFDTSVIDWPYYFLEVHCPAVTAPVRRLDELRALRKKPAAGGLRQVGSGGTGIAAFFDMDGTLLSSNVIETYLWVRLRELDGGERFAELGRIASKVPALVQAERRSRSDFLRGIYREYAGARLADLDAVADEHLADHILSRLSPDAVRRIREHRAAGHQTVLITGAIRPLTRPLLPLFDHIEAADLAVDDRGVCNGHLASSPLVGESRAAWMQSFAAEHDIDMKASYAYADSHSDLPLLGGGRQPGGRPARRTALPARPPLALGRRRLGEPVRLGARARPCEWPMILALEMFRSLPRTVAGKAVGTRMPGILSGYAAPLRLVTIDPPKVDRPGWARLRSRLSGICGSDLGALSGKTSLYFSAVVSLPFVPGHEVVAELIEPCEDLEAGTRVVLDPVLTCAARGVEPCENCVVGHTNRCSRITVGHLAPGLQTGFCKDTGGGWGQQLVAHRSQMHVVPEGWSDEQALLMEPLSCAVHTALRAGVKRERPGARLRRGIGRPVRHAGAAPAHPGRRDHRGGQARPPARPRAGVRRDRGGAARRGAAPRTSLDRRLPAQAGVLRAVPPRRRRRRRRRGRQQAVPGDRAQRHPRRGPGGAVRDAGGGRPERGVVPRARGGRHVRVVPAGDRTVAVPSTSPPSWPSSTPSCACPSPWPATRCTGGARPSTMPMRPAVSVR